MLLIIKFALLVGVLMEIDSMGEPFLHRSPPFSKTQVNRSGSLWRDGKEYDAVPIDNFIAFNAIHVDELLGIVRQTLTSLIIDISPNQQSSIRPDTGSFLLSARVKTKATLLEKMRRMKTTPLMNVQDVAGIRFDCDLTLNEQTQVAEIFAEGFRKNGAKRVDIRDLREEPHSGYRGIHLHIRSAAGRSEMQIRTALQSKWANVYEEAADIFGRDIRYLHEGAKIPQEAESLVAELLEVSELVAVIERLSVRNNQQRNGIVRELRASTYDILDNIYDSLRRRRMLT